MPEPVSSIPNLGPASEAAFARAGIHSADEIRALGADDAYLALLRSGTPPHFIGYYVLVMGLQGRPWNDCQGAEKKALRARFAGVGGRGVISVISHLIPKEFSNWMKRAASGESEKVSQEFATKYGALNNALYLEANPIPVKYALWKMGVIASPELRLPLTALDESHRANLDALLKQGGRV